MRPFDGESKTKNFRSAKVVAALSHKTIMSTGSLMTDGNGTPMDVCSAIKTTGSSQQATVLLLSMATVPSWGPSGSLKS